MKKNILVILLFSTPIIFFLANRILQILIGNDNQDYLKYEIIGSIICGYSASLGFWLLYRKIKKI